jgi:bacterioferritin (cytochrome b1)
MNMSGKEELIQGLNQDLAAELGTVIRYTYQSSKATGFAGVELREILAGRSRTN